MSGKYEDWVSIRVSNDAVKNISSAGLLREKGYSLQRIIVPRIVRLSDGQEVISANYFEKDGSAELIDQRIKNIL